MDSNGFARAGVIHTPHGPVRTPAFVPLASTGTVKSLHASEVAELGYVDGKNIFIDLYIAPSNAELPTYAARAVASAPAVIVAQADHVELADAPVLRRDDDPAHQE